MKTKRKLEEHDQIITTELIHDADGNVIAEEITCETWTRLPVVKLADVVVAMNDQAHVA